MFVLLLHCQCSSSILMYYSTGRGGSGEHTIQGTGICGWFQRGGGGALNPVQDHLEFKSNTLDFKPLKP